jgi:outer membrane protein assembly factor BamA
VLAAPLHAQEGAAFTVGDIRVEGLQRVTEGTVYNYLPINIGDILSPQRIRGCALLRHRVSATWNCAVTATR